MRVNIKAHSNLPGPFAEANALADKFTQLLTEFAQRSHALSHQNSRSLRKQFDLTREIAHQIVNHCDICPQYLPVPHLGVNIRDLLLNHLWQMDGSYILEFGKLKHVHVSIGTN